MRSPGAQLENKRAEKQKKKEHQVSMSDSGNRHIRKHTLIYCSAVYVCARERERAHPLRALLGYMGLYARREICMGLRTGSFVEMQS